MRIKSIFKEFSIFNYAFCIAVSIGLIIGAALLFASVGSTRVYNVDFSAIDEVVGDDGTEYLQLRGLSLRKGWYNINVGYVADAPANVEISLDNDTYMNNELAPTPSGSGSVSVDCELKSGTDRGRIDFSHPAGTVLNLAYITISSEKPMYYDGLIFGIALLLLIPAVWLGVYFFRHSTHKISLAVAVGLVVLQVLPFILRPGLHLGTDTCGQMMRIEGIYYGLLDGQFPVVIYPEWNNSYGQLGVLYPNIFLYIPALFRIMGMSQLGTLKLHLFIVICTSVVIALASARTIFRREWQITLVLIAICLDNMRLIDMLRDGRITGALIA